MPPVIPPKKIKYINYIFSSIFVTNLETNDICALLLLRKHFEEERLSEP